MDELYISTPLNETIQEILDRLLNATIRESVDLVAVISSGVEMRQLLRQVHLV